eukprot:3916850-Pyramimonas_sp.AAC.1
MNAFKQQVSRAKAEFLRRWVTRNSIAAFPHRAVGNMLSPPLQSADAPSPASTVRSHIKEIAEVGRRRGTDWFVDCAHTYALARAADSGKFRIPR